MLTLANAIRESQLRKVAYMHYVFHGSNYKPLSELQDSTLARATVNHASVYVEPYRKDVEYLCPLRTGINGRSYSYSIHTHVYIVCETDVWKVPELWRVRYGRETVTVQEGDTVGDFIKESGLSPRWIIKVDDTLETRDYYQKRTLVFTVYQYPKGEQ